MEEKFNAVGMVRTIRDKIYEETKNMTGEEFVHFINTEGGKTVEELKRRAERRTKTD